jgi:hypothetical protein
MSVTPKLFIFRFDKGNEDWVDDHSQRTAAD